MSRSPKTDTFLQLLALTCTETRRAFDRHVGMTQARRQLLTILADEGKVSHAELARRLGVDGAAVTRLVKGLEARGMVARRLDPDDNRFTLASLTEPGEARVADLRTTHTQFTARLLAGIGRDEQDAVLRVLERVRGNIALVNQAADDVQPH
jgi:MarR family transcriptional regulator for hemolysin